MMSHRINTAFQSIWYNTDLPIEVIDLIQRDTAQKFDDKVQVSKVNSRDKKEVVRDARNSKHTWIPTHNWIGGFLWHYIDRANRENFLYDLKNIDSESIQYTIYNQGDYYGWHTDGGLTTLYKPQFIGNSTDGTSEDFVNQNKELVRKLSFSLQLSSPEEYEGGELELVDEEGKHYLAPKTQGCFILFDSRTRHRVLEVTKGTRKSLVGWVVGPRWK